MRVPNLDKCLDKRRYAMPQIDSKDMEHYLNWLLKHGIKIYKNVGINPKKLIPTQKEFNFDKVEKLRKENIDSPILISKDKYILDGHHRWLANSSKNKINTHIIDLPIEDLIDISKKYPRKFTKKLHESIFTLEELVEAFL